MVKIRRGGHTLTVTNGAFKRLYAPMGYVVVEAEGDSEVPRTPNGASNTTDDHEPFDGEPEDDEEDSEPEETADYDEEEDELEEKPLSEMNFKELKDYASRHGINVNGMTSKQEVRRAIRDAGV